MFQEFDENLQANLEVALRRACQTLGSESESHDARRFVAQKLIGSARDGCRFLNELTMIGIKAAEEDSQLRF